MSKSLAPLRIFWGLSRLTPRSHYHGAQRTSVRPPVQSGIATRHASNTPTRKDSQTFTLNDGRVLGFSEYGCEHGTPLLFFHGFPSSRLEGFGVDQIARRLQIRVLTLDRPGFGISTFQPNRRIIDWPGDVKAFADYMGLKRFAILGGSGGCPYTLACAYSLPKEMLSAVGILSGGGPWDRGVKDIPMRSRLTHLAAYYSPTTLEVLTNGLVKGTKWLLSTGPVSKRIDKYLESQGKKAQDDGTEPSENLTKTKRRERLIRIGFEGFAQGAGAFTQEALLLSTDWGFPLERIDYNPIKIWHGGKDVNAPVEWLRAMAERIPHSRFQVFEDDTHFTVARHLEEILTDLVPKSAVSN
ncbi:hydrolase [Dendrothele bispora CBS 962.96]|uniref:Hydrolase n=1 Tax=Dendrothele bispora (strain CBS 962.96) TaxID=1314807 RepID=A0A4S8MPL7_DENBC|nr:hydrolase [Dendrothele bispora CBS 962.96]